MWVLTEVGENFGVTCPVLDELKVLLQGQYRGAAKGCKGHWQRFAEKGPSGFTSEMWHEADKSAVIYQLRKGDLRMYGYLDGRNLILSHVTIKKGNKVDASDVARAKATKEKYLKLLGKS